MLNFKMEIKEPFIKICPPSSSLQVSPRLESARSSKFQELVGLQERRIGNLIIKSERISEYSIDGYTAIFDQRLQLLFEGEFARSKKNGFGIEYDIDGNITFQGSFRDDRYDGWGRTYCYSGQFRDGLYDGYGVYSAEKVYYQGFFNRGLFGGEGIHFRGENMITFHPVKNINTFLTDGTKNGMDIMQRYRIDEIYLGEWRQGFKHGFGKLWRKGYWYAGQFSNDLFHGFGVEEDSKTNKIAQTKYKLGTKVD